MDTVVVLEPVDLRNVWMVERREHLGLALEAGEPVGVLRERGWQDLQRDIAMETGVAGAIDLAHSARADWDDDFIRAEASAGRKGHGRVRGL